MESFKGKTGVMIAMPTRAWHGPDKLPPSFRAQLEALAVLSETEQCPHYFVFATIEGGLCRGLNVMVHAFLESECKWFLRWDDDIEATVEDVFRLLSHKRPVVGGLYVTREERPHYVANFMHEVEVQGNGLLQVIQLGTGFKLYHRQVFEELARIYGDTITYTEPESGKRIHAFFQQVAMRTDLQPDGTWLTEDFFLDHLCRHAKVGIFADVTMKLPHRGKDGTLYPKDGNWPPIPSL